MHKLKHHFHMSGHMTADIDRTRQTCNMRGECFNIDTECRYITAETLTADAERIDAIKKLLLHIGIKRIGIAFINITAEGLFGKQCRIFKVPAKPHTDHYGRAGI